MVLNVYRYPMHVPRGQEIAADAVLFTRSAGLNSNRLFTELSNYRFVLCNRYSMFNKTW